MLVLEMILTICIVVLGMPVLLLLAQIIFAAREEAYPSAHVGPRPRVAVLVPAHNEKSNIAQTVACIRAQLTAQDQILVIADNCTDETAAVARFAGAQVFERNEPDRRGKGYALDCGVTQLSKEPPDVVIIIDADCTISSDAIVTLAQLSHSTNRPVQAQYRMFAAVPPNLATRLAVFAYRVKSYVRPLGYHRLGLPCHLQGTGMCFPWKLVESMPMANGQLVEDMKLGIDLAINGTAPLFCPTVTVTSMFPTSPVGVNTQRTRWEHGHLAMMLGELPRAAGIAIKNRDKMLLALALDGMVPPIALLALLVSTAGGVGVVCAWYGLSWPAFTSAAVLTAFLSAILGAWWKFGRSILAPGDLPGAALYALRKIPLYVRFIIKRQTAWVRTERD